MGGLHHYEAPRRDGDRMTSAMAALRAENDELRETVRQLREELAPARDFPPAWKLSPQSKTALSCIMAASPRAATLQRLHSAVYVQGDAPDWSANVITIAVCRLRRRLRAAGLAVEIKNIHGVGYVISAEDRDRLLAAMGADAP